MSFQHCKVWGRQLFCFEKIVCQNLATSWHQIFSPMRNTATSIAISSSVFTLGPWKDIAVIDARMYARERIVTQRVFVRAWTKLGKSLDVHSVQYVVTPHTVAHTSLSHLMCCVLPAAWQAAHDIYVQTRGLNVFYTCTTSFCFLPCRHEPILRDTNHRSHLDVFTQSIQRAIARLSANTYIVRTDFSTV